MNKGLFNLLLTLLLVTGSMQAFSQAGTLDPTFGNNGIVMYNSGMQIHDNTFGVHVYEDTSMIVCGTSMDFSYHTTGNIQKFLPDGSIDLSWGTNGMISIQYGVDTYPYSMVVLDNGKILISGMVFFATDAEFFAACFNPDGSADMTFNSTGVWIGSYPANVEMSCNAMAVQPDGKIILAGRNGLTFSTLLFYRLNSDGTLDTGFGINGYTEINSADQSENINGIGLLSDGSIIGVGYKHLGNPWFGEFAIMVKLTSSGNPYPGFGTDGVLIPSVFTDYSQAFDCVIVNDSVVISSTFGDSGNEAFAITKLDDDGNPDPNFGNNGISILDIDQLTYGEDIYYGGDNKFYIGGSSGQSGLSAPRDFFLARYQSDGIIDVSWNGTGYIKTEVGTAWDHAYALDMGPDGKIVLVGFSAMGPTGDNDRALARYLNDYIPPTFNANFTASPTTTCVGQTVSFTNTSSPSATMFNWTFEGGTPPTSTAMNPTVTYNALGSFDVTLQVSDGTQTDTEIKPDYITVTETPGQPNQPSGNTAPCQGNLIEYTTVAVTGASTYNWEVDPPDAGTISGTGTTGTLNTSLTWTGSYTVKVQAENVCGTSAFSTSLTCTLNLMPDLFTLEGEGGYCEGEPGAELTLDGSESGVDYELYIDGVASGTIVTGTGSSINFGYQTVEGGYTCQASSGPCTNYMGGYVYVEEFGMPGAATTPDGPVKVCNSETTLYTTTAAEADTIIWDLTPPDAGTMNPSGLEVEIAWSSSFTGTAMLSCYAENPCGTGTPSPQHTIQVADAPDPVITGSQEVCEGDEANYETPNTMGNTYTWDVSGGTIITGSGTYQITVLWGAPGTGIVRVTEENNDGCSTTTEDYEVTIDECTTLPEPIQPGIRIYPNPASEMINIKIPSESETICKIMIYSQFGQIVYTGEALVHENGIIHQVHTSSFRNGLYVVQVVTSDAKIYQEKIAIKQ
jgi:uncharacterized delta-60 repeat protein